MADLSIGPLKFISGRFAVEETSAEPGGAAKS
jgi:hypothetical protein